MTVPYRKSRQPLRHEKPFSMGCRSFENRICRRGGNVDPERTPQMKSNEETVRNELQELKSIAHMNHFCENPDAHESSWIPVYIKEVQDLLDCDLLYANRWMKKNLETKGLPKWKEEVHARRRIIAIYHQEIDLFGQGIDVPWLAFQRNESILAGCW